MDKVQKSSFNNQFPSSLTFSSYLFIQLTLIALLLHMLIFFFVVVMVIQALIQTLQKLEGPLIIEVGCHFFCLCLSFSILLTHLAHIFLYWS
jgi:hypothetical protein